MNGMYCEKCSDGWKLQCPKISVSLFFMQNVLLHFCAFILVLTDMSSLIDKLHCDQFYVVLLDSELNVVCVSVQQRVRELFRQFQSKLWIHFCVSSTLKHLSWSIISLNLLSLSVEVGVDVVLLMKSHLCRVGNSEKRLEGIRAGVRAISVSGKIHLIHLSYVSCGDKEESSHFTLNNKYI